tara:strand:- start:12916 stop:14355 length:1440 start_codon:yes stop_codon:yes gene_type:complete
MSKSVIKNTSIGVIWIIIARFSVQIISLLFLYILTRKIDPIDFGKAAIVISLFNIYEGFYQFIYYNIILLKNLNKKIISASLIISILISFLIIFFTYLIVLINKNFFTEFIILKNPTYLFLILIIGLSINFKAILFKQLDFKYFAFTQSFSVILGTGFISAIYAYYFNADYNAILIGYSFYHIIELFLILIRIKLRFDKFKISDVKKITSNGFTISLNYIVSKIALNGDYFIISSLFGPSILGLYQKAYELASKPINLIGNSLEKVGFASINDYKPSRVEYFKLIYKSLYIISFFSFPISSIIYLVSEYLIVFILGEKWKLTGELIAIISWIIFFRISYKSLTSLFHVKSLFRSILYLQIIYAFNIILFAFLFSNLGIHYVAFSVVLATSLHFFACLFILSYKIKFNFIKSLTGAIIGVTIAIVNIFIYYLISYYFNSNVILTTLFSSILTILLIIILEKIRPKTIIFLNIKSFIKNNN